MGFPTADLLLCETPTVLSPLLLLLACADPPPAAPAALQALEPPPPGAVEGMAIAISVPLSGPSAALGRAAVQGARLALPQGIELVELDEERGDPVPQALADARVIGVVAHVTEVGARRWARGWLEPEIAVVLAAPATVPGLPRVLAGADRLARCAGAFLDKGNLLVAHDGTPEAIELSNELDRAMVRRSYGVRTVDPLLLAGEAEKVRATAPDWLVYAGDASNGGNLLRASVQLGAQLRYLGLGSADPRFLSAAGSAAEGAILVSADRPLLETTVRERWRQAHGGEPPAVALNAYDAARLLVEAWATAAVRSKAELRGAVRQRLASARARGASGEFQLDAQGVATPAWCTAQIVQDGAFRWLGAARVQGGKVERVNAAAAPGG